MPLVPIVLDGAEGVLSKPFAKLHLFRIAPHPTLHFIKEILIHPTRDAATLFAACASLTNGTLGTSAGCVVFDLPVLLGGLEPEGEGFACGTPVAVLVQVVSEIFFAEETPFAACRSLGHGDEGGDACLQTGLHLLAMVIAHIGQGFQLINAEQVFGPPGHGAEQIPVGDFVGDHMVDDELVLFINAYLRVTTYLGSGPSCQGHEAAVRVSERDLRFSRILHLFPEPFLLFHPVFQAPDLFLEFLGCRPKFIRLLCIVLVQLIQVGVDFLLDILHRLLQPAVGEVAIAAADRFELRAVDGHQVAAEKVELAVEECELPAHLADGFPIMSSKVGEGLQVGRQAFDEVHDLDVAMRLFFQVPTGSDAIEVTITVELQQITRMVRRSSGFLEGGMGESNGVQVRVIDEGIDKADRVLLGDVLVQGFRKEGHLVAVKAFDMLHGVPRSRQGE